MINTIMSSSHERNRYGDEMETGSRGHRGRSRNRGRHRRSQSRTRSPPRESREEEQNRREREQHDREREQNDREREQNDREREQNDREQRARDREERHRLRDLQDQKERKERRPQHEETLRNVLYALENGHTWVRNHRRHEPSFVMVRKAFPLGNVNGMLLDSVASVVDTPPHPSYSPQSPGGLQPSQQQRMLRLADRCTDPYDQVAAVRLWRAWATNNQVHLPPALAAVKRSHDNRQLVSRLHGLLGNEVTHEDATGHFRRALGQLRNGRFTGDSDWIMNCFTTRLDQVATRGREMREERERRDREERERRDREERERQEREERERQACVDRAWRYRVLDTDNTRRNLYNTRTETFWLSRKKAPPRSGWELRQSSRHRGVFYWYHPEHGSAFIRTSDDHLRVRRR